MRALQEPSALKDLVLEFLFPRRCSLCGQEARGVLCQGCQGALKPYEGAACRYCALPLESPWASACGPCLRRPPSFQRALSFGLYEGALKEAVHLMKFASRRQLAAPLAERLLMLGLPQGLDAVLPVPMTKRGLLKRGFNQSALLAREVARRLGLALLLGALRKRRHTPRQTTLPRQERLRNLRGAFEASGVVKGKRLLLVDDVMTTGATLEECARALRRAQAKEVYALVLARATGA
jgi:ComF family protein